MYYLPSSQVFYHPAMVAGLRRLVRRTTVVRGRAKWSTEPCRTERCAQLANALCLAGIVENARHGG